MSETAPPERPDEEPTADPDEERPRPGTEWTLWPPSPKMQIVLITIGFGLFNLMLIAIWAWVMVREFG
jgi:hypothetical protein